MFREIRINVEHTRIVNCENKKEFNKIEEINRDSVLYTNDILYKLEDLFEPRNEILPINCRFIKKYGNGEKLIIIEDTPKIRTCRFNIPIERIIESHREGGSLKRFNLEKYIEENEKPYKLRLSFPFVIYLFRLSFDNKIISAKIFFRLSPLNSIYDYLLIPNLLNVAESSEICIGKRISEYNGSAGNEIENFINTFWSNNFNFDYTTTYHLYSSTDGISDPFVWAYYTKVNPMFVFEVKWKKYNRNLKQLVKLNDNRFNYPELLGIFSNPYIKENRQGYYINYCEDIFINNKPYGVGDELKFKNKTGYIKSFSKKIEADFEMTHINIEFDDKIIPYKLTSPFKEFICNLIKENEITSITLNNGETIQTGDILKLTNGNFMKVVKIFKAIDGVYEILNENNSKVLVDRIDGNVLNLNEFNFNGKLIFRDAIYTMYNTRGDIYGNDFKIKDVNLHNNKLKLLLKSETEGDEFWFAEGENSYENFINNNDVENPPNICCYGINLIKGTSMIKLENRIFGGVMNVSIQDLIDQNNLSEDRFYIKTNTLDIEFNVGDSVVVPNWENPVDTLNIKKIAEIKWDEETFKFVLVDAKGIFSEVNYYEPRDGGILKIGSIRKISKTYNGVLYSGVKIKAKVPRLTMFPKKDTNLIIGIIETGNEPLVLCSNCCTIWFNDLNKFDMIKPGNPKYKKLPIANININKIKFQSGDLVINNEDICILSNGTKRLYKYKIVDIYRQNFYDVYLYSELSRYGIITPRLSGKEKIEGKYVNSFPNLHGSFIPDESSRLKF